MLALALAFASAGAVAQQEVRNDRLVFGSFRSAENAENWAQKLNASLGITVTRETFTPASQPGETWHRVLSGEIDAAQMAIVMRRARSAGVTFWRLTTDGRATVERSVPTAAQPRLAPPTRISEQVVPTPSEPPAVPAAASQPAASTVYQQFDLELGAQASAFAERGLNEQDRVSSSVSLLAEYYATWADDRKSVTFSPFVRLDSTDSRRTHGDIRELFYSHVGNNWDLHIGAKRIFWGVTEFHHLVDIVNQTDLVENIDGEDKLGQPLVQLSLVRDWGIVDAYLLTGFRERTFPGPAGRLRLPIRFERDARYESSREDKRVDVALRWSHHVGAFEFGLHHFSGTSRDPLFEVIGSSQLKLRPYYPVIDQTGVDAQALFGDWALKLEGMTRSGFGDRYAAVNLGLEKTLVGVFGSQADLGVVMEYMYDERGADAVNTLFENDVALGGRLALNDFANTQALLGVIVDTRRNNYALSLEASRQLADNWHLVVEGRAFGGGKQVASSNALLVLSDPDYKHAWLDREDYLKVEIKKYF